MEIINDFVATAEPVGSRTLAKKHFENLSAATIRNVMSDLEDLGYLQQPHTSAGRIPTDKGYRYFVDQLLGTDPSIEEASLFPPNYNLQNHKLEEVLGQVCSTLSQNSNQTGLVMVPRFSHMLFKHIEFVKVGTREALAVFISDMGVSQNKVIPIHESTTQEELASVSNYLNREFSGKSLKTIRKEILHRIHNEKEHYDQLMKKSMEYWAKTFSEEEEVDGELYVEGTLNFFDHPEFVTDLATMKALFKALEEKNKMINLLDLCLQQDGMTIIIGKENSQEEMHNCSLIAQNYQIDKESKGTMAIFGPKRMDYKKMISIVNQTAKTVSTLLSKRHHSG